MGATWDRFTLRERAEIVRRHAAPQVSVAPGMKVCDLAKLFQISEEQVNAVLGGADFPGGETDGDGTRG